jgi:hypothetical protein
MVFASRILYKKVLGHGSRFAQITESDCKDSPKTVTADGTNQSFLSSFVPFAACWFLAFAVCARSFM